MIILLYTVLFINLLIFLLAIKVISSKGGMKFLKVFLLKRVKPNRVASDETINRMEEFSFYKSTENDIVFLGDSLTQGGQWAEFFPEFPVRNRGIGGESTSEIIRRLDMIIEGKPEKLFILMGINDLLSNHKSVKNIMKNYSILLNKLKKQCPSTKIYVQSILPINKIKCEKIFTVNKKMVITLSNDEIRIVNNKINDLCNKMNITYINCYNMMIDDKNELQEEFTSDGVHLTIKGYSNISRILTTYIYNNRTEKKENMLNKGNIKIGVKEC